MGFGAGLVGERKRGEEVLRRVVSCEFVKGYCW
jgi:hypothetical protein